MLKQNKKKMAKIDRSNFLEDRTVILKPIIKPGSMNGKGHDGEFMYTGTEVHYVLPYNIQKGRLETILTPDEQDFFENLLDLDLSIHKKEDNFWHSFKIKIRKDEKLMTEGYSMNLNDPIDNLRWRVLKLQRHVAPSWGERFNRAEYQFALVGSEELTENRARIADKRKEAYMFLGKIDNSESKMRNFLRVYGKAVSASATLGFMKGEIDKLIENPATIDGVLDVINDPNYEMKLFIDDAVECGALVKKGKKYYLQGGDPVNENDPSLEGTVRALNAYKRDTDDIYLRIDTQIKNANK